MALRRSFIIWLILCVGLICSLVGGYHALAASVNENQDSCVGRNLSGNATERRQCLFSVLFSALKSYAESNGITNQTRKSTGVSSIERLENFFKRVYTVPDYLFNVSKIVVGAEVKNLEEIVVNETQVIIREASHLLLVSDDCHCEGYTCGCCAHLEQDEIHLNSTICVNVSYLPHDYGISFVMTLNEYVLYNETISVRNPPPICVGMPFVEEFAELCARLYDIDATPTKLHACVRVEARLKRVLIAKYELGCFNLGLPGEWLVEFENSIEPSVIRI